MYLWISARSILLQEGKDMDVKEILKDEKLVELFWNRKITLCDGSIFATLQKYLEAFPEQKVYLAKAIN